MSNVILFNILEELWKYQRERERERERESARARERAECFKKINRKSNEKRKTKPYNLLLKHSHPLSQKSQSNQCTPAHRKELESLPLVLVYPVSRLHRVGVAGAVGSGSNNIIIQTQVSKKTRPYTSALRHLGYG